MPTEKASLLAGRNKSPLSSDEIRRAANTFLGLDNKVKATYEPGALTRFRENVDESTGEVYGEIIFGPDIYPGKSVVDPNSALSLQAAAAHELTHFHRWKDKIVLQGKELEPLDEALTSLQAVFRYDKQLSDADVRQLIADALQRLQLFVESLDSKEKS